MARANYNCTQAELYTIVALGWASCLANLASFTSFSAAYVTGLVTARQADLVAAQTLPDFQARNAIAETFRLELIPLNSGVCNMFQRLKRYISIAFPAAQHQSQWDAAGLPYYAAAASYDWDATQQMLVSMTNYIALNSVALLANSNMPSTFSTDLSADSLAWNAKHTEFLAARQDAYVATEAKVNANNAIYADLIAMFSDAAVLGFSPALAGQFVFSSLLTLISGTGVATLQGVITDDVTGLPIAGASVTLTNLGVTVTTTTTGEYNFPSIAGGNYDVQIDAVGYAQVLDSVTVTSGVTTTKDYALVV